MRANIGNEITGLNRIEIDNPAVRTVSKLMQDCIQLLDPSGSDITIYSKNQVDALLKAQTSSNLILETISEIRDGLIKVITDLTAGIGETMQSIITNNVFTDPDNTLTEDQIGQIIAEALILFSGFDEEADEGALSDITYYKQLLILNQIFVLHLSYLKLDFF